MSPGKPFSVQDRLLRTSKNTPLAPEKPAKGDIEHPAVSTPTPSTPPRVSPSRNDGQTVPLYSLQGHRNSNLQMQMFGKRPSPEGPRLIFNKQQKEEASRKAFALLRNTATSNMRNNSRRKNSSKTYQQQQQQQQTATATAAAATTTITITITITATVATTVATTAHTTPATSYRKMTLPLPN